ncbi:uncharacterized protein LOC100880577 isoform X3 [Megachile rotundata]|uniref:uncharacterized protein LOC100880577 isoform X3 n=1 Tax=Megachile rotundata TaxID=143995 RepID=UPI003FD1B659
MVRSCFIFYLFLLGYVQECWQLIIKEVNVPATVKVDTDYVILDCDYDLQNTPAKGLVVKWFFNTNEVAYQWIQGRVPLAGDITRHYVDLTYKASDDPYTEYRAMKLNKPGIDLTGEYTCVISTFADEMSASAPMIVYSTEKKFELVYRRKVIDDKDGVEISCIAEGLYPEPTLDISIEGVPDKTPGKSDLAHQVWSGLYDILSRRVILDEDLPGAAIVKCVLGIPAANYSVSHETVYYPGTPTTTTTATTMLEHKMEIQEPDNSETGNGGGNLTSRLSSNIFLILMPLILVSIFK